MRPAPSSLAVWLVLMAGLAHTPASVASASQPSTTLMPTWYQLFPASSPAPRDSAAIAYDSRYRHEPAVVNRPSRIA